MALKTTVGAFNSSSYVTATEADEYFRGKYDTSNWDGLSRADKEALLRGACNEIDLGNYAGDLYYERQALQFPRSDHVVIEGACASPDTAKFKHTEVHDTEYGETPINWLKHGSIHFTTATLFGETYVIASNDTSDFVYTASTFSSAPTTTTNFIIFSPIDKEIKDAQCEQAISRLDNNLDFYAEARALGIYDLKVGDVMARVRGRQDNRAVPVMCMRARKLMSRYFRGPNTKIARA